MYEDNPMARVGELFEADLFGARTALGRRIIGEPELIKTLKREQIVRFWRKHYQGANIVLSLAGRFNSRQAAKLLADKFGGIKKGGRNQPPSVTPAPGLDAKGGAKAGGICAYRKDTNQAHVVMGWPALPNNHPDRFALALLSVILGGNMSSRLFIKVRERLGLCYFINCSASSYEDAGSVAIAASLDLGKIDKAFAAISAELKDVKQNGVRAGELQKAQQVMFDRVV
jgi:predicted Zn-dependent peptidase